MEGSQLWHLCPLETLVSVSSWHRLLQLLPWDWTSTQRAEVRPFLPFGAGLCCCSGTAGNLGHGALLRMQRRTVPIEERLISVYDYVCRLCQKFMSNNSLSPTDVPGINQPSSVWLRLDFAKYKLNDMQG